MKIEQGPTRIIVSMYNLANVAPGDALGLETLRLSLRADTFGAVAPLPARYT